MFGKICQNAKCLVSAYKVVVCIRKLPKKKKYIEENLFYTSSFTFLLIKKIYIYIYYFDYFDFDFIFCLSFIF